MLIMGLEDEYAEALKYVEKIDFTTSAWESKGFETNIRYLGGLLSANDLRANDVLVKKAVELIENALLPLFDSPSKAPYTYMDLNRKRAKRTSSINLAEFGTYNLEFTRLSQITGNATYAKYANDLVDRAISEPTVLPGLFPTSWTTDTFKPINSSYITIAGGGDSFYEYLIKNYILLGGSDPKLLSTWKQSVESIEKYLLTSTAENPRIKFVGMIDGQGQPVYVSQELICFWPGNILLGISQMSGNTDRYRQFADTFMASCHETWASTTTGIAPESWQWNPLPNTTDTKKTRKNAKASKRAFTASDAIYDLRPETLESLFYYYRVTGSRTYQDTAWEYFQAINKYTRTPSGFTRITDVDSENPQQDNFQESFFLAETLKYLYLIFVDKDCISLNDYVFNTEAHPFKLNTPINVQ
ncbi:glycoside hydrolase [Radiomyces spectabilis]|uniref:glycoside hydrolase n=1 Tax=Radiomyces spectabilis TaxID=64574 RepID=UPI00221F2E81|nr:glycoside hydrolase [Radiomyces spectabilis]KAI8388763.1 glycoside hydrolase [Radiomyces spectabilis]